MSVLMCLAVTLVRIPSIMEHLSLTTLTTTLHSIKLLATTLLDDTILLKLFTAHTFSCINSALGLQVSLDSRILRMGLIGCPKMSVRNYHYLLRNKITCLAEHLILSWHCIDISHTHKIIEWLCIVIKLLNFQLFKFVFMNHSISMVFYKLNVCRIMH